MAKKPQQMRFFPLVSRCTLFPPLIWDQWRLCNRHTVPTSWHLLLRMPSWRHGAGSPLVPASVSRHFVGHLFHRRLNLVTLTGLEYARTPLQPPTKGWLLVLVLLRVELNTWVFKIYLFYVMSLGYLDIVLYVVNSIFPFVFFSFSMNGPVNSLHWRDYLLSRIWTPKNDMP